MSAERGFLLRLLGKRGVTSAEYTLVTVLRIVFKNKLALCELLSIELLLLFNYPRFCYVLLYYYLTEWTAFAVRLAIETTDTWSNRKSHEFEKSEKDDDDDDDKSIMAKQLKKMSSGLDYLRIRHTAVDEISLNSIGWTLEPTTKSDWDKRLKKARSKKRDAAKVTEDSNYERRIHDMCKLVYLGNRHLAESPGDVQVGDRVFITQGFSCCLLLRPRGPNRFMYVGRVFVGGMAKQGKDGIENDPAAREIILI